MRPNRDLNSNVDLAVALQTGSSPFAVGFFVAQKVAPSADAIPLGRW